MDQVIIVLYSQNTPKELRIKKNSQWTEISCEYNIDNNSTRKRNNGWDPIIADWVDKGLSKKKRDSRKAYKN